MIDWLNANASAVTGLTAIVTAFATIVLAVLTVIYIRQNGRMIDQNDRTIKAMQDQLELSLKIHEQDRRDLQEARNAAVTALRVLAGRLLRMLAQLPSTEPVETRPLAPPATWR